MAPFLPIRALNRSSAIRINKQKISPTTTTWIDLGATGVPKELAYHSSIGQIYVVGPLTYTTGSGGFLRATLASTPAAQTNTTETLQLKLAVPASFLAVGSILDVEAVGTMQAASAGTVAATVRLGTVGTTADASVCTTGATGTVTTSVGWRLEAEIECRAIGSGTSASVIGNARLTVGTATLGHSSQSSTVTFDSTVGQNLDLTFTAGGGTPSLQVLEANIKAFQ